LTEIFLFRIPFQRAAVAVRAVRVEKKFWLPSRVAEKSVPVGDYGLPRYHGKKLVGALLR
jgi:hypothetical protein